jgi:hypothetical protein
MLDFFRRALYTNSWCRSGFRQRPAEVLMKNGLFLLGALSGMLIAAGDGFARTSLTVTQNPSFPAIDIPTTGQDELVTQFQRLSDLNGPIYSDAYLFSNIIGYPVGQSTLGSFPHFQIGVAAGSGMTIMDYFGDGSPAKDNGSVPGIAPTSVLHAGVGLAAGLDVLVKFFSFNLNMYDPEIEYDKFSIKKFSVYSAGGRIRYNVFEEKTLIPFLLSFNGLTVSVGGDMMRGNVGFAGEYSYDFDDITVDPDGAAGPVPEQVIPTYFTGDYQSYFKWYQLSGTAQATVHFDIAVLFTFYTGLGINGGYGWVDLDFGAQGRLTTDDNPFLTAAGITSNDPLGTVVFESKNRYNPYPFLRPILSGWK